MFDQGLKLGVLFTKKVAFPLTKSRSSNFFPKIQLLTLPELTSKALSCLKLIDTFYWFKQGHIERMKGLKLYFLIKPNVETGPDITHTLFIGKVSKLSSFLYDLGLPTDIFDSNPQTLDQFLPYRLQVGKHGV